MIWGQCFGWKNTKCAKKRKLKQIIFPSEKSGDGVSVSQVLHFHIIPHVSHTTNTTQRKMLVTQQRKNLPC